MIVVRANCRGVQRPARRPALKDSWAFQVGIEIMIHREIERLGVPREKEAEDGHGEEDEDDRLEKSQADEVIEDERRAETEAGDDPVVDAPGGHEEIAALALVGVSAAWTAG